MKSQVISSLQLTLGFLLLTSMNETTGLGIIGSPKPFPPKIPVETCLQGSTTVIGLKPNLITGGSLDDCKQFWYCRVTGLLDLPTPNDTLSSTTMTPTTVIGPPVFAENFTCDADPNKPYYNAEICECVETADHCDRNIYNIYTCTRPYNIEEGEPLEDCRAFGPEKVYYLNQFSHYNDPTKFWNCGPHDDSSSWVHLGIPNDCPQEGKGTGTIVWDIRNCSCNHKNDDAEKYDLHTANIHPMNRFNCAIPFVPRESPEETCLDENGTYYAGFFPNINDESQNSFWECLEQTQASTIIATPEMRSCADDHAFNINECNCTARDRYDFEDNLNPDNRYKCARMLDSGVDPEPTCEDRDGFYHIGDIPNFTNCSTFYSCIENDDPIIPSIPILMPCALDHQFHVLTCNCELPGSFPCEDNLDPKNTYRCANQTVAAFRNSWD